MNPTVAHIRRAHKLREVIAHRENRVARCYDARPLAVLCRKLRASRARFERVFAHLYQVSQ